MCPLYEELNDCSARKEKSCRGEDVITKGLTEVGEEEKGTGPRH